MDSNRSAKTVVEKIHSTPTLTGVTFLLILPTEVAELKKEDIMTRDDEGKDNIRKLTDFVVCDSVLEAEAAMEESDLPVEAFDRRMVRYYSQGSEDLILIFACPRCVEGARKTLHGRQPLWDLLVAKLRFFRLKMRKR